MSEQEHKAARLSREAEQALEVLKPAIDGMMDVLSQGLAAARIGQNEEVLAIHAAMVTTQKVKAAIIKIIADGQLAEHALMQADILKESK